MSEPDKRPRPAALPARFTRPVVLVVSASAVVLAILAAWLVWQSQQPPAGGDTRRTVAEFNGNGDLTTSPFSVSPGWQIHWQTEGPRFAFAIRGDYDFGTVISQDDAGSGVTTPVPTGSFYLEISAEGPWSVTVLLGD